MPNEASWGMHPYNWVRPRAFHALAEDIYDDTQHLFPRRTR